MATINAWNSQNPAEVTKGGTGIASSTAYAVLCGGTTSTGPIQSIASVGTTGQALTSNGAGALPTFQSLTQKPFIVGVGSNGNLGNTTVMTWSALNNLSFQSVQTNAQSLMIIGGQISNLYINVSSNTCTSNVTYTINVNSVNTSVVITIPALTTGLFSDTINTASFVAGDLIQIEATIGTVSSPAGTYSLQITPT